MRQQILLLIKRWKVKKRKMNSAHINSNTCALFNFTFRHIDQIKVKSVCYVITKAILSKFL